MATCKSCGAEIIWALTVNGKRIPLDVEPSHSGNIILEDGVARVVPKLSGFGPWLTSHFVTCPNAEQHRNPRERKGLGDG